MKKLLHLFLLIVMMFNMLTIGVYAIDNNANDIVLNRKEYALSKIKSVNMFGTENACDYNRRPFYTVHNRNIYYIDQNSILKTIDIDTKTEESILDINKWIKEMSDEIENNPYSSEDDIYLQGGKIKQLFNDTYRNRMILEIYLEKPREHHFYSINFDTLQIEEIKNLTRNYFSEWLSVSAPDCIYGENGIYDETGIKISESIVKSGNVHGVYSEDDGNLYVAHETEYGYEVFKIDQSGQYKRICGNGGDSLGRIAFYNNFVYSIDYGGVNKYNYTGAERKGIDAEDIAIYDGLGTMKGQPMFTGDGDMIIFNGTTFRLLSKNKQISFSVKNNTTSTKSVDLYIVIYDENKMVSKVFLETEDIGTKNEFEKSINYKITDSETVSMFCWQHGTVKPLCKAYKSEE